MPQIFDLAGRAYTAERWHGAAVTEGEKMKVIFLENEKSQRIRNEFMKRFLLSWEEFQFVHKDWLERMAAKNDAINRKWFDNSYMWDRLAPPFEAVQLNEAAAFLSEQQSSVFFISERGEETWYEGKEYVDYAAQADAGELAEQIKHEWYTAYRLAENYMYDDESFINEDVYVFDEAMNWCVVFTHESTCWRERFTDPVKAAENRYCLICRK